MKTWKIPVSWEVVGVVEIQAPTLDRAIEIAKTDDTIKLPYGEYVCGSFDVTVDDDDLIRNYYTQGQQDENSENSEEVSGNA